MAIPKLCNPNHKNQGVSLLIDPDTRNLLNTDTCNFFMNSKSKGPDDFTRD